MSIRKRKKMRFRGRRKRRERRAKLKAAGKNPDEFFYSGIYVGKEKE